jgi:hypothetical protein
MKRAGIVLAAAVAIGVAGCDNHSKDDTAKGADINFAARDGSGKPKVTASADGNTGRVSVSTPGFDVNLKLPKISLGADDFDIDGVKLYPGSRIDTINIDADGKDDKAAIDVAFTAPDDAKKVSDWFAARFAEKKIKVERSASGLAGKTTEGTDFVIEIDNAKAGGSTGAIHIAG